MRACMVLIMIPTCQHAWLSIPAMSEQTTGVHPAVDLSALLTCCSGTVCSHWGCSSHVHTQACYELHGPLQGTEEGGERDQFHVVTDASTVPHLCMLQQLHVAAFMQPSMSVRLAEAQKHMLMQCDVGLLIIHLACVCRPNVKLLHSRSALEESLTLTNLKWWVHHDPTSCVQLHVQCMTANWDHAAGKFCLACMHGHVLLLS